MNANKKSGLSAFIGVSGGVDAGEALARADLHLASIRSTVEKSVEESINAIGAFLAPDASLTLMSHGRELHQLSDGILSVAGLYDKATLGKIAYSLCDLVAIFEERKSWEAPALRLHYDAMRLMQAKPDLDQSAQDALVEGLAKVVDSIKTRPIDGSEAKGCMQ